MKNIMSKDEFYSLLKESVIVQAGITFVFTCVIAYLVVTGKQVPEIVTNAYLLILGFYFGSKSNAQAQTTIDKLIGRM